MARKIDFKKLEKKVDNYLVEFPEDAVTLRCSSEEEAGLVMSLFFNSSGNTIKNLSYHAKINRVIDISKDSIEYYVYIRRKS